MARIPFISTDLDTLKDRSDWSRYVYVAAEAGNQTICKIGRAANPKTRLKDLQCGNSRRLFLVSAWQTTSSYALEIERNALKEFGDKKISGEWFDISPEDAVEFFSYFESGGDIHWENRRRA